MSSDVLVSPPRDLGSGLPLDHLSAAVYRHLLEPEFGHDRSVVLSLNVAWRHDMVRVQATVHEARSQIVQWGRSFDRRLHDAADWPETAEHLARDICRTIPT